MTHAKALAEAQKMKAAIERYGVRVSIELQQGVGGSGWYSSTRRAGVMSHHTVSRPRQGNTPILAMVKKGRPADKLAGPLCNGYMGYDLVYRIITMGWANHPGLGGPITLAGRTVPKNNGRPYFWGTEFEGGLEAWTPEMRDAMARANRGILDYLDLPVEAHVEHSTWTSRKIDRLGYSTASGRNEIRAVSAGAPAAPEPTSGDDDMPLYLGQIKGDNRVWVGDGLTRRHLTSPAALSEIQAKINAGEFKGDSRVRVSDSVDWLGQDVSYAVWNHVQVAGGAYQKAASMIAILGDIGAAARSAGKVDTAALAQTITDALAKPLTDAVVKAVQDKAVPTGTLTQKQIEEACTAALKGTLGKALS